MPIKLTMVRSVGVAIAYLTKPTVTQFDIRFYKKPYKRKLYGSFGSKVRSVVSISAFNPYNYSTIRLIAITTKKFCESIFYNKMLKSSRYSQIWESGSIILQYLIVVHAP